jgi:hypothetical protein
MTFGRKRNSTETHFYCSFGAETETDTEIRSPSIMPLSHYGCMQPACSLHVDRLPVVDAVQPSANALQAIDIRGFADRHASY